MASSPFKFDFWGVHFPIQGFAKRGIVGQFGGAIGPKGHGDSDACESWQSAPTGLPHIPASRSAPRFVSGLSTQGGGWPRWNWLGSIVVRKWLGCSLCSWSWWYQLLCWRCAQCEWYTCWETKAGGPSYFPQRHQFPNPKNHGSQFKRTIQGLQSHSGWLERATGEQEETPIRADLPNVRIRSSHSGLKTGTCVLICYGWVFDVEALGTPWYSIEIFE